MKLVNTQKLNPGESMSFRRPNATEAAVFVAMSNVEVDTYEEANRVQVIINFEKPFIEDKEEYKKFYEQIELNKMKEKANLYMSNRPGA